MAGKFKQQKEKAVSAYLSAREKGETDVEMHSIIDKLNSYSGYYTTSSCAGRTSVFHDLGSKKDSTWIGKWHREVLYNEVKGCLKNLPNSGMIWFMHEPTILHVVAEDFNKASSLMELARNHGFKKTSMLSFKKEKIVVEICGTERIDAPIASEGELLTDDAYIMFLTEVANSKFRKGMSRLRRFEKALNLFNGF